MQDYMIQQSFPSSGSSDGKNNDGVVVLKNQKMLLVRRPDGLPKPEDFRLDISDLVVPSVDFCPRHRKQPTSPTTTTTTTTTTSVVLETMYVSIDPAMRGWMSSQKSYLPPVKLGSVMRASTVCRIVALSSPDVLGDEYPIGAVVRTEIVGVQSHNRLENCTLRKARKLLMRLDHNTGITDIDPSTTTTATTTTDTNIKPLSFASFLGVLGTTGLTAYFGLLRVGKPKATDTVLVSGAAGATGSIVCQIAKHVVGCKLVIGTAGTDAKCRWLESNRIVDVAINYRKVPNLAKAIYEAAASKKNGGSGGVDLVFDNVGSTFLEAALGNLSMGARIVLCGAISQYNSSVAAGGPRNYMNLLVKRATMTGFVVLDYTRDFPVAIAELTGWIADKKISCCDEDKRHSGIYQFYPALMSLFRGTNIGKVVLTIKGGEESEQNSNSGATAIIARSRL